MDQQHPVELSHSPSSVGPEPEVVVKNNNKEVERSHDSCREISERRQLTEMKVGWSPRGFSFPFCSLVKADIIYIRCGLAKSVREVSRKEKKKKKKYMRYLTWSDFKVSLCTVGEWLKGVRVEILSNTSPCSADVIAEAATGSVSAPGQRHWIGH